MKWRFIGYLLRQNEVSQEPPWKRWKKNVKKNLDGRQSFSDLCNEVTQGRT